MRGRLERAEAESYEARKQVVEIRMCSQLERDEVARVVAQLNETITQLQT